MFLIAPLAIAAAAAAIPELMRTGVGIAQGLKGRKLRKGLRRPLYETPADINEVKERTRLLTASPYLPGQTRTEENITKAGSNAVGAMTETGHRDVSDIFGQQLDALGQLGLEAAGNKMQRDRVLNETLLRTAPYQDKEFQINKQNPYDEGIKKAEELGNASTTNIFEGAKNLAAIGLKTLGAKSGQDTQDKLDALGTAGVGTATPIVSGDQTGTLEKIIDQAIGMGDMSPEARKGWIMMYLNGKAQWEDLTQAEKALLESKGLKDYRNRQSGSAGIALPGGYTPPMAPYRTGNMLF